MSEAMNKHPDADCMINFASLRSAYDATLEAMQFTQVSVFFLSKRNKFLFVSYLYFDCISKSLLNHLHISSIFIRL